MTSSLSKGCSSAATTSARLGSRPRLSCSSSATSSSAAPSGTQSCAFRPHGAARASGKRVAGWRGLAERADLGSEVDRAACAEPRKHLPELRLEHWSLVWG